MLEIPFSGKKSKEKRKLYIHTCTYEVSKIIETTFIVFFQNNVFQLKLPLNYNYYN